MADKTIVLGDGTAKLLHDNGDGTYCDVVHVDTEFTGTVEIGATVALGAGTAEIGHLTANQSVNNAQVSGTAIAVSNGVVGNGVQRVTLASDSTGQVAIAAGTANIGKLTDDQKVDVNKIGGAASPIGAGLEATALRVTLPTDGTGIVGLAAGTNAFGKLAANSGVDIGDVDVTSVIPGVTATALGKAEDAAHSSGDTGVMVLAVRNDTAAALAGTTGDYIPLTTDSLGNLRVALASTTTTRVSKRVAMSAGQTGGTVWTPTGGKKFVIRKLMISCVVGGTVEFFDGTDSGNTVVGPIFSMAANSGWSESWKEDALYISATADNVLKYTSSASFVGSVYVEGYEL